MKVRARACIKCKQYMRINPSDPLNQIQLKLFEKWHLGHTLITIDVDEIRDTYRPFKKPENIAVAEH